MGTAPATAVPGAAPGPDSKDVAAGVERDDAGSRLSSPAVATTALLGGGIAGRVAFQHVPSVEPLVAAAVAAGFYGTWRHGAFVGAAGFAASNALVWGGQGPWTLFQALGAGGAGLLGAALAGRGAGAVRFGAALVGGTVAFEAAVNIGGLAAVPFLGAATLLAAVPFGLVHLASTIGFGMMLYGCDGYLTDAFGGPADGRGGRGRPGGPGSDSAAGGA